MVKRRLTSLDWDAIVSETQRKESDVVEHKYQKEINRIATLINIPIDLNSLENRAIALYKMIVYLMRGEIDFSISNGPDTEPLVRVGEVTRNTKRTDIAGMLAHVMCLSLFKSPTCSSCGSKEATRTITQADRYGSIDSNYCDACLILHLPSLTIFTVRPVDAY